MSLRKTDPRTEMAWAVVIQEGPHEVELEWFESQTYAEQCALKAIDDAKEGGYVISAYVLHCLKQSA